jgi:hypothetical protein
MIKRVVWGLVLAAVMLLADGAAADTGKDKVDLVGGGFFRGTVLVLERGKRVVIQLADGKTETVTWDKIAKVTLGSGETMEGGKAATSPKPDPGKADTPVKPDEKVRKDPGEATAPSRAPTADEIPEHVRPAEMPGYEPALNVLDPNAPREVMVVIEGGTGLKLMRDRKGETESVCNAPCGKRYPVLAEDRMYVVGDGMPSSRALDLYDSSGDVKAVVKPGSNLFYIGGIVVAVAGFGTAVACTTFTVVEHEGLSYWPPEPEPFATALIGAFGAVVGVGGTIAAVMMRTEVTIVDKEKVSVGPGGVRWRF